MKQFALLLIPFAFICTSVAGMLTYGSGWRYNASMIALITFSVMFLVGLIALIRKNA